MLFHSTVLRQIVWSNVCKVFLLCSSSIRHSFQILIHRLLFFKSPALTFIFRTSSLTCYKHRGIMEQKAGENSPSFIPSLLPVVAHVQRTEVRAGEGWWDVPHRTSAMCSFHQRRQQRPHHTGQNTPANESSSCSRHNTAWTRALKEDKLLSDTALAWR